MYRPQPQRRSKHAKNGRLLNQQALIAQATLNSMGIEQSPLRQGHMCITEGQFSKQHGSSSFKQNQRTQRKAGAKRKGK